LSKYGIKVTDVKKSRVLMRHPLHWIANITYYEDTYGKHMLVLRQGKQERSPGYQDLFIYEATDEVINTHQYSHAYYYNLCIGPSQGHLSNIGTSF